VVLVDGLLWGFDLGQELGGKKQRNAKPSKNQIFLTLKHGPHLNLVNPYLELVIVLNELE